MDKIFIRGIAVSARCGVTEQELKVKQKLVIDLDIKRDLSKAYDTDLLEHTIDYSEVTLGIKKIVEEKDYKLLETLANEIAKFVLRQYQPESVSVKVHKPEIASMKLGIRDVGVKITRTKE